MSGGEGRDVYRYEATLSYEYGLPSGVDYGTGRDRDTADLISDFNVEDGDVIDMSLIRGSAPFERFSFLGSMAFSGRAGELRYEQEGGETIIYGEVDGKEGVDLVIRLYGLVELTEASFVI
jgi:hypothetical protein